MISAFDEVLDLNALVRDQKKEIRCKMRLLIAIRAKMQQIASRWLWNSIPLEAAVSCDVLSAK